MSKPKLSETLSSLDGLLAEVIEAHKDVADIEARHEADLEALKKRHAVYAKVEKDALAKAEKALTAFAKANKIEIFGDSDRCDVPHGAVVRAVVKWVVKAKKVTPEALEKAGYAEAVKIAKSVDWDQLEKWPDEKLIAVGTERKSKEEISWEVAGDTSLRQKNI